MLKLILLIMYVELIEKSKSSLLFNVLDEILSSSKLYEVLTTFDTTPILLRELNLIEALFVTLVRNLKSQLSS